MTIDTKELQGLCEQLGLPVEDQGDGAFLTLLPFKDAKERESYGALLIESAGDGREIRLRSVPLFLLADVSPQSETQAQFMASLLKEAGAKRVGSVGMDDKGQLYYFLTAVLEENTLTMNQLESLLVGMMEGIRSTYALARQFSKEPAEEGNEELSSEQKLQQILGQAEQALASIEKCMGTEEQQEAAWQFINELLKPGRLPEEFQAELARLARPAFVLDNSDRLLW